MNYHDLTGREIKVGDYIVYAAAWGRCAVLKYGRVSALTVRKGTWNAEETPTVKVLTVDRQYAGHHAGKCTYRWELQNNGKPITLAFLDRLMVVDDVPERAQELLGDRYTLTDKGREMVKEGK